MRRLLALIFAAVVTVGYLLGIRKKVTLENLRYAFPDSSETDLRRILYRSFLNLSRIFSEIAYLRFASRKKIANGVVFDNPDVFEDALKKGKGVIIVSGHYGNWEWMALAGPLHLQQNYSIVVKNLPSPWIERLMTTLRKRTGNELIPSADIRRMFRVLSDGKILTLLGDQSAPSESVRVPFFGYQTPTYEGPARLALRTRASLLFASASMEDDGKYHILFTNIQYDDLPVEDSDTIYELTARHTRLLEEAIRRKPEQWLWQHRRWKYVQR